MRLHRIAEFGVSCGVMNRPAIKLRLKNALASGVACFLTLVTVVIGGLEIAPEFTPASHSELWLGVLTELWLAFVMVPFLGILIGLCFWASRSMWSALVGTLLGIAAGWKILYEIRPHL